MAGENLPGDEFPPKVPCPGLCAYGACGEQNGPSRGPYGCGGCCRCLGGCQLEWEVEQAYIPLDKAQAEHWRRWENLQEIPPEQRFTL